MRIYRKFNSAVAEVLQAGGVGVMPTDTIYGIVGSALNKKTVNWIYKLRRRNPKKPMIVLIGSMADLKKLGVKIDAKTVKILEKFWPHFRRPASPKLWRSGGYGGQAGKVSIILPCKSQRFAYLHRGTKGLAFRLPRPHWLRRLLAKTGPLVAPSANLEGKLPAHTTKEAQRYFGDGVDFYVDARRLNSKPSTLIKIEKGKIIVLRKGAYKI